MSRQSIKRPLQAFPMVEIIWDDASELPSGWSDEVGKIEPKYALSVGFLIEQTKDHLILAQDTDEHAHHNGRGQIPMGMVKKIKVLRKADK